MGNLVLSEMKTKDYICDCQIGYLGSNLPGFEFFFFWGSIEIWETFRWAAKQEEGDRSCRCRSAFCGCEDIGYDGVEAKNGA